MGKKYILEYKRDGCIGAAACVAVKPETWQFASDNKADIREKEKKKQGDLWILEIDEKDLKLHLEAAQICPVNVIKIKDKETGKYLV